MISNCSECTQKNDLIEKYLKLIKLLKAKCEKNAKQQLKNNTNSSDTLFQSSCDHSESNHICEPLKSQLQPQKLPLSQRKLQQVRLALLIINNKSTKSLLNHSLNKIKHSASTQKQNSVIFDSSSLKFQGSLSSIIRQTLSYGKSMLKKTDSQSQFQKQLLSKIFCLQVQNQSYLKKIDFLQKEIQQSEKRFFKQTEKKRESLQAVAEQIRQKSELVVELQHLIKRYEKALGRRLENITVQSVLVQDTEEIKKTCLRLQGINEKLNDDIRNLNFTLGQLNKKLLVSMEENEELKKQNKKLRQNNFQLQKDLDDLKRLQESYKTILKRLDNKILSIQMKQKKIYESMKLNSQLLYSANIVSTKNTDFSLQSVPLQKRQSQVGRQAEQKIQEIFTFLFNIKNLHYQLKNIHLFDEEELDLLKSHKTIYLKNLKQDSFIEVKRQKLYTNKNIDDSNFDENDQIYYKKGQNLDQQSFFCALDPTKADTLQLQSNKSPVDNMKLIELQIQKTKLIEKICELKNHQMHIRNVILNLLKVFDLSNLNLESQGVLQIIFDFFQYSQDEKSSIFRQKKKKFWGII